MRDHVELLGTEGDTVVTDTAPVDPEEHEQHVAGGVALGGAGGAAAGFVIGAGAGPVGAVVGGIIGAVAGGAAGGLMGEAIDSGPAISNNAGYGDAVDTGGVEPATTRDAPEGGLPV